VCLFERVGEGLRLRLTDVEDIANDGTGRMGDRREVVCASGDPKET